MTEHTTTFMDSQFASLNQKRLEIGQELACRIVSISDDTIFLDLNGKSEGILDAAELRDPAGHLKVHEGDTIKVYFLGNQQGEARFTTRISGDAQDNRLLEQAWRNKIPVQGLVEREIKGGYEIKIGNLRAFCPFSQMGGRRKKEDNSTWVGKHLTFIIQEYRDDGKSIVVSNRAVEEQVHAEHLEVLKK
ncbi:MAG: 30S ribosomal protein S1, partial [Termitinemataceae bacterium]